MQENEFEKKVRNLMDDLEIAPSAPVWDYVEKRIPKSNRRRRFIALFFLLAGFAVCSYFFYTKFSDNKNEISNADKAVHQNSIAQKTVKLLSQRTTNQVTMIRQQLFRNLYQQKIKRLF
jgi:hypothetical protein